MNKFMFFACLAVLGCSNWASARPDVSLGYNYQKGLTSSISGGGGVLSPPVITSYQPTASANNYFGQTGSLGGGGLLSISGGGGGGGGGGGLLSISGGGSGGGGLLSISGGGGGGSGAGSSIVSSNIGVSGLRPGPTINYAEQEAYLNHLQNFQPPLVTKQFYLHTAPEDHDEQQIVRYVNIGRPQKNYRVVFINAPSSSASKAKIIANVAPQEEKTAIYVLAKKSNALDVSAEVVTQSPVKNKPEVYFIKYKTPQEAQYVRQTIQAQYDSLGGTSEVNDGGVVPVTSVIGSVPNTAAAGESGVGIGPGSLQVISTNGGSGNVGIDAAGSNGIAQTLIGTGTGSGNGQISYLPPVLN